MIYVFCLEHTRVGVGGRLIGLGCWEAEDRV